MSKQKWWLSYATNYHGDIEFHSEVVDVHPFVWMKENSGPGHWKDLIGWQPLTSEDIAVMEKTAV